MPNTIAELARKRQKWVEANRENNFESGLKRLLTDLYPDNAHFIYELLQNAEDAHAQEVRFILYEDRIEFEHNGKRLFSFEDVDAITSIGFSTKRDDPTNIGKFGVGFKAVFAYTDSPEIHSGEYHFRIHDLVVPEQIGFAPNQTGDGKTRFKFPFNNPKKPPETALAEIDRLLKLLDATTLLFLSHVRRIEYSLPKKLFGFIERGEHGDSRYEIRVQLPNENKYKSTWFLRFDNNVQVIDDEDVNEEKLKVCRISIAFGLELIEKNEDNNKIPIAPGSALEWELIPIEPGRVCIYFPADKETSNLHFHLHAPFASTVARDSVRDCPGNAVLLNHLASLLAESMQMVRSQGLLTVKALAMLPNDKDNLREFYKPIQEKLVHKFKEENLTPMKKGGHAMVSGIFRGVRKLSDLICDEDMVILLGENSNRPIWVANPPQRNQREDCFLSTLGIEEWCDQNLVSSLVKMDEDTRTVWMSKKPDEWHQRLYALLMEYIDSAPQQMYSVVNERRKMMASCQIIRVSNGSYMKGSECFFPSDDVEHDDEMPRIAKGVYSSGKNKEQQEKSRKFLKELGVQEVDEVERVINITLSKYKSSIESHISDADYQNDLTAINNALTTDSYKQKRKLVDFLENTYYVKSVNAGTGEVLFNKPADVYFPNEDLSLFFEGNHEIWLVYDSVKESFINNVTINRDFPKIFEFVPSKEHSFWVKLRGNSRCTTQENKIDKKLDGLDCFFKNIQNYNLDIRKEKYLALWRILVKIFREQGHQHESWNYGFYKVKLFRGEYTYQKRYITPFQSNVCELLQQHPWLLTRDGNIVRPLDAYHDEILEIYYTSEDLLSALNIKQGKRETEEDKRQIERKRRLYLAEQLEVSIDDIEFLKKFPEEFNIWKNDIAKRREKPPFPSKPVTNCDRRQDKVSREFLEALNKEYEQRSRSVRITEATEYTRTWLKVLYTNESEQMVCQICKEVMPFKKRNGTYFFEAVELFSKEFFNKEHEAQYLALCPICAAKYKEFIKNDKSAIARLKDEIVRADNDEILITLGDQETSIRFVQIHYHDLKVIIK